MKKKFNKKEKTLTKFNRIIDKVISGLNKFSKEMNNLHLDYRQTNKNARRLTSGLEKMSGVNSSNRYAGLMGSSKRDYSALIG